MSISKDKKGTHTIQSMLDVITMSEEEELVASDLRGHVFELANVFLFMKLKDPQATHVIQKALLTFNSERQKFIMTEAIEKFKELSNDANGLCLIKKLLTICRNSPQIVSDITTKMTESAMELAQNPYGNYAIQIALENFTTEECAPILESIKGKYAQLSMLKFSSNAVERCIEKANLEKRNEIIKEIISSEKFLSML